MRRPVGLPLPCEVVLGGRQPRLDVADLGIGLVAALDGVIVAPSGLAQVARRALGLPLEDLDALVGCWHRVLGSDLAGTDRRDGTAQVRPCTGTMDHTSIDASTITASSVAKDRVLAKRHRRALMTGCTPGPTPAFQATVGTDAERTSAALTVRARPMLWVDRRAWTWRVVSPDRRTFRSSAESTVGRSGLNRVRELPDGVPSRTVPDAMIDALAPRRRRARPSSEFASRRRASRSGR